MRKAKKSMRGLGTAAGLVICLASGIATWTAAGPFSERLAEASPAQGNVAGAANGAASGDEELKALYVAADRIGRAIERGYEAFGCRLQVLDVHELSGAGITAYRPVYPQAMERFVWLTIPSGKGGDLDLFVVDDGYRRTVAADEGPERVAEVRAGGRDVAADALEYRVIVESSRGGGYCALLVFTMDR